MLLYGAAHIGGHCDSARETARVAPSSGPHRDATTCTMTPTSQLDRGILELVLNDGNPQQYLPPADTQNCPRGYPSCG